MGRPADDGDARPNANREPPCNSGYAEPKPRDKQQARVPGAKKAPDSEEGGLEHDPDPDT